MAVKKKKAKAIKKKAVKKTKKAKRTAKIKKGKAAIKKRKVAKKISPKKPAAKKDKKEDLTGLKEIGKISHYFPHVKAAVLTISKGTLSIGDQIYIKGHTTRLKETITSMQINRLPITQAKPGDEIGLLVKSRVRINDTVYKI